MKRSEIEAHFERYGPMVLRRARAILGSNEEAQDLAQEVFIKALQGSETFEARSHVATWLYRITTNCCLNHIRDVKRRAELREEHLSPEEEAMSAPLEQQVLVRRLLAEAEDTWAQAAIYVHIDGMSHREAADLMGVSRRTVGNLLERFQAFASQYLQETTDAAVAVEGAS